MNEGPISCQYCATGVVKRAVGQSQSARAFANQLSVVVAPVCVGIDDHFVIALLTDGGHIPQAHRIGQQLARTLDLVAETVAVLQLTAGANNPVAGVVRHDPVATSGNDLRAIELHEGIRAGTVLLESAVVEESSAVEEKIHAVVQNDLVRNWRDAKV